MKLVRRVPLGLSLLLLLLFYRAPLCSGAIPSVLHRPPPGAKATYICLIWELIEARAAGDISFG
jgi:hypothetical protein